MLIAPPCTEPNMSRSALHTPISINFDTTIASPNADLFVSGIDKFLNRLMTECCVLAGVEGLSRRSIVGKVSGSNRVADSSAVSA